MLCVVLCQSCELLFFQVNQELFFCSVYNQKKIFVGFQAKTLLSAQGSIKNTIKVKLCKSVWCNLCFVDKTNIFVCTRERHSNTNGPWPTRRVKILKTHTKYTKPFMRCYSPRCFVLFVYVLQETSGFQVNSKMFHSLGRQNELFVTRKLRFMSCLPRMKKF